jgi:hypothetical protein
MLRFTSALLLLAAGCGAPVGEETATTAVPGMPDTYEALPTEQAPPPGVYGLRITGGVIGGTMEFNTTGANAGERVYLMRSTQGVGPGPCFAAIGGQCLSIQAPVVLHDSAISNGAGNATIITNIPNNPALNGREVCFQAGLVRGPGGASSVLFTPVCSELGYDADNDYVIDAYDQCPGFDDGADADGDGIPDGCDVGGGGVCGDWLVGTACNGIDYGNGCTPADTGYHYRGRFASGGSQYECWWHTRNQAWNTSTNSNIHQLGLQFGLNPNIGTSNWCFHFTEDPCAVGTCGNGWNFYSDVGNIGAWGWCAETDPDMGGFVCFEDNAGACTP